MEKILNKIKENQLEIISLKDELNQLAIIKYNYLIGKYYILAATEFIKITDINYVENNNLHIECIRIFGGKHSSGEIRIDINFDYDLNINDINSNYLSEITKESFIKFVHESFDETNKVITELIKN